MEWLSRAIQAGKWGDVASVVSVLITLVGFLWTLIALARSKSAAKRVAEAVADVQKQLSIQGLSVDLAALMSEIEEIKHLHRLGVWQAMPTRYTSVRKQLLTIKETCPVLTKSQKSSLQGVLQQMQAISDAVETALAAKRAPQDAASLTRIASAQGDKLTSVLLQIQQSNGEKK